MWRHGQACHAVSSFWLVRAVVLYLARRLSIKPRFPAGCLRLAGSSLAFLMVAMLSNVPVASPQSALLLLHVHRTSHVASRQSHPWLTLMRLSRPLHYRCVFAFCHSYLCLACTMFTCAAATSIFVFVFCPFVSPISCLANLQHGIPALCHFCLVALYDSIFVSHQILALARIALSRLERSPVLCSTSLSTFFVRIPHFSYSSTASFSLRHLSYRLSAAFHKYQRLTVAYLREARACKISAMNAMDR